MHAIEAVNNYIVNHWLNTVRTQTSKENEIPLPYPVTVPCENQGFTYFFYWDTYFANIGLLYDMPNQALNNLRNMKYLVERYGFIPNANLTNMLNRSQPPLYSSAVFEYYERFNSLSIISEFYPSMVKEYNFWMNQRMTRCGLNRYLSNANDEETEEFIREISLRKILDVKDINVKEKAKNLFAEAESGWDFCPRFSGKALNFVPVDLNSILYRNECIMAYFAKLLGKKDDFIRFNNNATKRKRSMMLLMQDANRVFCDYDFIDNYKSRKISVANLLPYWAGISDDKDVCVAIVDKLNFKYGLSACEKNDDSIFQWDYPNMWPPLVEFAVTALENVGEREVAKNIAFKYLNTVASNFVSDNSLFEKYSVVTGKYSEVEYQSPRMMGWTAAVFRKLYENFYKQ